MSVVGLVISAACCLQKFPCLAFLEHCLAFGQIFAEWMSALHKLDMLGCRIYYLSIDKFKFILYPLTVSIQFVLCLLCDKKKGVCFVLCLFCFVLFCCFVLLFCCFVLLFCFVVLFCCLSFVCPFSISLCALRTLPHSRCTDRPCSTF